MIVDNSQFLKGLSLVVLSVIILFGFTIYLGSNYNINDLSSNNKLIETSHFDLGTFTLFSSKFDHLGTLPTDYTCGGDSMSPPLSWVNTPKGTNSYVITMSSYWSNKYESGIKYDWLIYNISGSLNYLDEDVGNATRKGNWKGVIHGGTYPNKPYYYYVAPCSEGWGMRYYTFTIFALNTDIVPLITADESSQLNVANNMIDYIVSNNFVISNASITVGWERYEIPDDFLEPPPPPPEEDEESADNQSSGIENV